MRRIAAVAAMTGALALGVTAVATPAEAVTKHYYTTSKSGLHDTGGTGYYYMSKYKGKKIRVLYAKITDYHKGDKRLACLEVDFTSGSKDDAHVLWVPHDGKTATGKISSYNTGKIYIRECKGYKPKGKAFHITKHGTWRWWK